MSRFTFLNKPYPVITGIFGGQTPAELIADSRHTEFEGAQGIAIDLSDLKPEHRKYDDLKKVIDSVNLPFMFYFYRNDRWAASSDQVRQELLLIAADAGAAMIDVMGDLYDPSPMELTRNPAAIDKQKALINKIHTKGAAVVISSHMDKTFLNTDQVVEHMLEVESRGPDVVKIVTGVNSQDELVEAIRTTMALKQYLKVPFIHLCNGTFSRPHRFLGPSLGVSICFSIPRYEPRYAMTQPTIRSMKAVLDNLHWNINDVES